MIPRSFVMLYGKHPALVNGYFAGDAWTESDESFQKISGSSFGVIIFEDMREYRQHKSEIRIPTIEEWQALPNKHKEICYKYFGKAENIVFYEELPSIKQISYDTSEDDYYDAIAPDGSGV